MALSVALIVALGMASVYASDVPCNNQGGHCQEETNSCSGSYASGLCSGHASRKCCLAGGSGGGCSNINIVSRAEWGAQAPTHVSYMHVPVHEFFIHHTEGNTCHDIASCSRTLHGIQNYHMNDRGWSDIGYSFLIGEDGRVYEGRGWTHVGAHTKGYNSVAFAASFMGSYMTHAPPAAALNAAKELIACGIQLGKIAPDYRLFGHRDAGLTDCPGDALYAVIQGWQHYSHAHP